MPQTIRARVETPPLTGNAQIEVVLTSKVLPLVTMQIPMAIPITYLAKCVKWVSEVSRPISQLVSQVTDASNG